MTIEVTKENKDILEEALRLFILARIDHIELLKKDSRYDNEKAIEVNKAAQEIAETIWSNIRES